MFDIGNIYQADSVPEALAFLGKYPKATIISGGTDVLIKIREGKMDGCDLIDISNIAELKGVTMAENGDILIASATSFAHITQSPVIQKHIPILGEAVDQVGGPQIRNMGTIGGNLCNGVTSADSGATCCALNAIMMLESETGKREVPINEWYAGAGKTVRAENELLLAVKITKENYAAYTGHYIKYGKRKAMEIATLGCAVVMKVEENQVKDIRLAYGVAGPNPMRCPQTERQVIGKEPSLETAYFLGAEALNEVNPRSSWRASREFRLQLVEELAIRAFVESVNQGGGNLCLQ
ncbi:MAG: xanthine dehydrogenase subunit XdhB [Eubacteriales bacterium]